MSIPRNIPRILVDWDPPPELTASETLDIREVVEQAGDLPNLLSRNSAYDLAASALWDNDLFPRDVPAFPDAHKPPLFIVQSHLVQLPFPLRPEVQEIGDVYSDAEGFRLLPTIPTIPRMKLMIRERIFVPKWVNSLTTDDPPQHVPWAPDRLVPEKKWVSEGSIFPAEMIQSLMHQRREGRACTLSAPSPTPCGNEVCDPEDLRAFHEASMLPSWSTRGKRWTIQVPVKPVASTATSSVTRTPCQTIGAGPIHSDAPMSNLPLAVRRGRMVSSLQLKRSPELEYPDFPTAFRCSSSAQFDLRGPIQPFTEHREMLSSLRSKCATLANVFSTVERERGIRGETDSLTLDEWGFSQELASFERQFTGSVRGCSQRPSILRLPSEVESRENTSDPSGFNPESCSTSVDARTATIHGAVNLHCLMPSSFTNSSEPPGVPLPLRPALMNPATPAHVRGILKKAKSVRFEDLISSDVWGSESTRGPRVQEQAPVLKRPSPLRQSVTRNPNPDRLSNLLPSKVKTGLQPAATMEAATQKAVSPQAPPETAKRAPRPRLAPKDTDPKSKRPPEAPNLPPKGSISPRSHPSSKGLQASSSVERPCRISVIRESSSSIPNLQAQGNQRGSLANISNLRRGSDGVPKSRLAAPLRNIFGFK